MSNDTHNSISTFEETSALRAKTFNDAIARLIPKLPDGYTVEGRFEKDPDALRPQGELRVFYKRVIRLWMRPAWAEGFTLYNTHGIRNARSTISYASDLNLDRIILRRLKQLDALREKMRQRKIVEEQKHDKQVALFTEAAVRLSGFIKNSGFLVAQPKGARFAEIHYGGKVIGHIRMVEDDNPYVLMLRGYHRGYVSFQTYVHLLRNDYEILGIFQAAATLHGLGNLHGEYADA